MRLDGSHARQGAIYGFAGEVHLDKAMGLTPLQSCLDAAPNASTGFRLGAPDRCKNGQDIFPANLIYPHLAQTFECVSLELLHPVRRNFFISPSWTKGIVGALGSLAEERQLRFALGFQRVATTTRNPAILICGLARLGQSYPATATEPDIAALAVNYQTLDPLLGSTGRDPREERVAIAVQSRFVFSIYALFWQIVALPAHLSLVPPPRVELGTC